MMCCGLLAAIFAFRIYWVSGARGTGCRRLVCLHPVPAQPKQTRQGLGSVALRVRFAKRPSAAPKKMATSGPAEARRGSAGGRRSGASMALQESESAHSFQGFKVEGVRAGRTESGAK